jgi:hypothetical protein
MGRKLNACLFFPWVPICPSKICPVVTKHILKLPIHILGPLIYIYIYIYIYICIIWSQMCLGSIHLFRKKTWMGLRADNEKRKQTVALYCLLVFRSLGWINNNVFCTLTGWVWVTPTWWDYTTKVPPTWALLSFMLVETMCKIMFKKLWILLKIEPYLKHTVINLAQPVFVQPLHKTKTENKKNSNLRAKQKSTHKPHTTASKLLINTLYISYLLSPCEGFSSSSSFSHLALVSVILSSKIWFVLMYLLT